MPYHSQLTGVEPPPYKSMKMDLGVPDVLTLSGASATSSKPNSPKGKPKYLSQGETTLPITPLMWAISPITGWESVPYGLSTSGGGGGGGGGGAELPTTGLSPPGSPLSTSVGAGGEHIHSSQLHSSEHGNNAFFSIDGGESNPSQVPAEAALTPL